jgi:hypothetical protein
MVSRRASSARPRESSDGQLGPITQLHDALSRYPIEGVRYRREPEFQLPEQFPIAHSRRPTAGESAAQSQIPGMRAVACVVLTFTVACERDAVVTGAAQSGPFEDAGATPVADSGTVADGGSGTDAGSLPDDGGTSDAGRPSEDAGVPDAGLALDAGPADAGAPAIIGSVACPETPPLLWSRTIDGSADYRLAADPSGNLYWIESDSIDNWSVVSVDPDGRDRYRLALSGTKAVNTFVVSSGKVLLSEGTTIKAYDTATGALAWTLDMTAAYPGTSAVTGFADLGNGDLAISFDSGLYFIEIRSGKVAWSQPSQNERYTALSSDGTGSVLVTADVPGSTPYFFVVDSTGTQNWRQQLPGATGRTTWLSDVPWVAVSSAQEISPSSRFVTVPSSWFGWVGGGGLAFSLFVGEEALSPITVQVIRDQVVVARGPLPGEISFNPFRAVPFLAGRDGDHLLLVGQSSHDSPGLCFPVWPGQLWVARIDDSSIQRCPLSLGQGTLWASTSALIPGRLVVNGNQMINRACGGPLNPYVIAAFGVPGESLAPSGWVQQNGSPGLGARKQIR